MTPIDRMLLVVPAWNEAQRLPRDAFLAAIQALPSVDLLLVDDGSTDDTGALLRGMADQAPGRVEVMALARNGGKAEAVRLGLLEARRRGYGLAGYVDADLAAPLDSVVPLRAALDADPARLLALGSRVKLLGWRIERSALRHYLGRVFATCASLALALPVYDTQCGAKLLRLDDRTTHLLDLPFLSRWLFDVELIARLRDAAGAAAIYEVPLPVWRDGGGSSLRIRDFVRAPFELWAIRRRYPPHAAR
jgi:glycosyltransferase involved in cell wall biosynthesis